MQFVYLYHHFVPFSSSSSLYTCSVAHEKKVPSAWWWICLDPVKLLMTVIKSNEERWWCLQSFLGSRQISSFFPHVLHSPDSFLAGWLACWMVGWIGGCATEKWDLILTHNIFTGTYYGRLGINCTKNRLNLNELTGRDRRKRRRRRRLVGGWNGWVIADWGSVWQSTQYADGTLTHL